MITLEPLRDLVESERTRGRLRDWRLFWTSWETSRVGVKDRVRAGVHSPLALAHGFAVDYLLHWDDGWISSGAAEKIAIADPDRLVDLARRAAFEDPDGANFAEDVPMPEVPLHAEAVAEDARSGGVGLFAPLLEAATELASKWSFSTWSGSVSAQSAERGIATSRGLDARVPSTSCSYSFWFEGRTGDADTRRTRIDAGSAALRIDRACDLVSRLGSSERSFAGGVMPVLLHPDVVDSLVATYLVSNLHGERIYHGQSAFRLDQFGSTALLFAPAIGLRLEPLVPMDTGSFRFTIEGVPARPVTFVAGGRLAEPILDMKYARRLGRPPIPGPASSESLRLEGPAPIAEDEALRGVPRGVLVLSLLGLHTQDSTRGDFSVSAPQTLAILDGRLGGAVKAVLTGNFFEVLRDPRLRFVAFEGFRTPGLLFDGSVGVGAEP